MVIQARLQSFPRIYMCLCHLCQKWHKWHNVVNVNNSAKKCANALKIGIYANSWMYIPNIELEFEYL